MLRIMTAVGVALFLSGFQSASSSQALPPRLVALTEDPIAAREFDYMALKAEGLDLKGLGDAVYRRTTAASDGERRCLTDAEAELHMGLIAAASAPTAATFLDDRAAAAEAWGKWTLFAEGLENGQTTDEPPFSYVVQRFQGALAETRPRIRELLTRTAKDQMARHLWGGGDQIWGPLSPGAKTRIDTLVNLHACRTDADNTTWLKAEVAANGWFLISTAGQAASSAAWLMAQHADHDRDFQRHVLAILEPLVATGETSHANYAYLWDRVAVGEGRPQRYGTQGRCVAANRWEPNTLEDPSRVEALRTEADIGTLEQYQTRMHTHCAGFTG